VARVLTMKNRGFTWIRLRCGPMADVAAHGNIQIANANVRSQAQGGLRYVRPSIPSPTQLALFG